MRAAPRVIAAGLRSARISRGAAKSLGVHERAHGAKRYGAADVRTDVAVLRRRST